MKLETETALVEATLFLEGEPLDVASISRITNLARDVVQDALARLAQTYLADDHGMELIEIGGGYVFSPKRTLWPGLRERYGKKNDKRLSQAALETLSIIAYSQPITRAEIENLRGVSADGMIRQLQARGLIREVGKKDAPGRPAQYGTTKDFLKVFRLSSIADLPRLDEPDRDRFELNG